MEEKKTVESTSSDSVVKSETVVETVVPTKKKFPIVLVLIVVAILLLACCGIGVFLVAKYGTFTINGKQVGGTPAPTVTEEATPTSTEEEEEETTPTPTEGSEAPGKIETKTSGGVTFTSQFLGLNAEWAPTQVKVTSPVSLTFEYPTEYGDITIFKAKCEPGEMHAGKTELDISFSDSPKTYVYFNLCSGADGGNDIVKQYTLTAKSGQKVKVIVYDDYEEENDYYSILAFDPSQDIHLIARIDKGATYDDELNQVDLLIESINLK